MVAEEARIEAAKCEAAERAAPAAGRRRRRGPDRFAPGQAPTDGRAVASSLRRGRLGVVRQDLRGRGARCGCCGLCVLNLLARRSRSVVGAGSGTFLGFQ